MKKDDTAVVVIDVQGRLAEIVHESEKTITKVEQLAKGAAALNLPLLWLEQYPQGLGRTVEQVANAIDGEPIEKFTFSAWRTEEFKNALLATNKKRILLCGIEAHICVYQTAIDLRNAGFFVEVVADAVSSRTEQSYQIALQRLQQENILLTTVEMALFEIVETATASSFKRISKIIK